MTPEAQRIAIAEACGLKHLFTCEEPGYYFGALMSVGGKPVPDYLNDLNAMHEAEKVLTNSQHADYYINLQKIDDYEWMTTASQRAEAFLRTLGPWKDKAG